MKSGQEFSRGMHFGNLENYPGSFVLEFLQLRQNKDTHDSNARLLINIPPDSRYVTQKEIQRLA